MAIRHHIPNAITCGNLVCGCLALFFIMEHNLVWASYMVGIALVLDFLDGFAARMLGVTSSVGKDLDSLADMVTFGVVPGFMLFKLLFLAIHQGNGAYDASRIQPLMFVAFLVPVFSAIRLAKFNNDPRQTESFIGVPTPAIAILVCSFPLILFSGGNQQVVGFSSVNLVIAREESMYNAIILNKFNLVLLCLICPALLVSEIPLFSFKFKHFRWKGNEVRYGFAAFCALMIPLMAYWSIPAIIVAYILASIVNNIFSKKEV